MVNTTAPDFESSVVGQPDSTMKLSDYKGKWVLLDFWFMGCKPCIALFPKVEELYHNYHAKGFEVIGINDIDKNSQKLADFVKDKNIPYITLNAEDRKVSEMYHVTGYPTFVLINPQQVIVEVGYLTEIIEVLKKHLK